MEDHFLTLRYDLTTKLRVCLRNGEKVKKEEEKGTVLGRNA